MKMRAIDFGERLVQLTQHPRVNPSSSTHQVHVYGEDPRMLCQLHQPLAEIDSPHLHHLPPRLQHPRLVPACAFTNNHSLKLRILVCQPTSAPRAPKSVGRQQGGVETRVSS